MSLPPGIYMIRNRATGYFIIPDEGSTAGVIVTTTKVADEVPTNARISVQKDSSDLYTFKSDSNLSIGDSGGDDGNRYLEWQEGDFKWAIRSAGPALWNIKLPNDPLYATDDRPPPPPTPFLPGPTIPSISLPMPVSGMTDNQIILNISIVIPLSPGNIYSLPVPSGRTGSMPAPDGIFTGHDGEPLKADLVLKKNGGSPSCARWEFINASGDE